MKILHINTSDISGGAARAAYRLHKGLRQLGQDSLLFVSQRGGDDQYVKEIVRRRGVAAYLSGLARRYHLQQSTKLLASLCQPDGNYFSDDRSEFGSELVSQLPACDLVHLHWIAGFVNYKTFFRSVTRQRPLVWTLHDTNPFTGGCHYYGTCRRFNDCCGSCPQLGSRANGDLSRAIWKRKEVAYSSIPDGGLHIVTPSRWLAAEARQSALLGRFPISIIPYGLDTCVFSPRNRLMAREALDIPGDSRVILFASEFIQQRRKGFAMLVEALAPLAANAGIQLVSLGRGTPPPNIRLPTLNLGPVENDRILSLVYSAADLYVIPTMDDNMPNTVIESMSCGTPVVGFETGGVPDMVRNGVNGFVVPKGDPKALLNAMLHVLDSSSLRNEMSQNSRRIAVDEYDIKLQAKRYLSLYGSITLG